MSATFKTDLADVERTAERLLRASAKHTYDPDVHVDWDAALLPDRYFLPPHRCSLYGTELWETMTEAQRIELSMHEWADILAVGVWSETILMYMLVRESYRRDPSDPRTQYILTEVADECRHSVMFGRVIAKLDCPHYGARRWGRLAGGAFMAAATRLAAYTGALIVEEWADALQREMMADKSLQPLAQQVSRVHVMEESRHISYAEHALEELWDRQPRVARSAMRLCAAVIASVVSMQMGGPDIYARVGLDAASAWEIARANPAWRASKVELASKLVTRFRKIDLIGGPGVVLLRRTCWLD